MRIRTATLSDRDAVREFLEGLSADTRWLRYHTGVPTVRSWMVDNVVKSDGTRHEALLAEEDGRIVGIAEWGRVDPSDPDVDVAIVVSEDCRRHGIARMLMRRLARSARTHGIETFSANVLASNKPTFSLIQSVAPQKSSSFDGGTVEVRIPLRAS